MMQNWNRTKRCVIPILRQHSHTRQLQCICVRVKALHQYRENGSLISK